MFTCGSCDCLHDEKNQQLRKSQSPSYIQPVNLPPNANAVFLLPIITYQKSQSQEPWSNTSYDPQKDQSFNWTVVALIFSSWIVPIGYITWIGRQNRDSQNRQIDELSKIYVKLEKYLENTHELEKKMLEQTYRVSLIDEKLRLTVVECGSSITSDGKKEEILPLFDTFRSN
jgi:hypothetical protein